MSLFNPYTFKKYTAFILCGFMPVCIFFFIMSFYKNFWWSLTGTMVGVLMGLLMGCLLIKNPFSSMLEGNGLLVFDFSSTGILQPFIMRLDQPYIKGRLNGKDIADIFDRNCVFNLAPPEKQPQRPWWKFWVKPSINWDSDKKEAILDTKEVMTAVVDSKNDIMNVKIDLDKYHKSRFGMMQWPVLLYNSQIHSLITKDFIGDQEKFVFSEHMLLYLNRKLEELNSLMRDFVRYIIEQLKPKSGLFEGKGWLIWIILIVFFIAMALLFGKPIYDQLFNAGGSVIKNGAASAATGPIVPR